MAIILPCVGPYVGTYGPHGGDPLNLGVMRQGYDLAWRVHLHDVRETISWGRTLVEQIYLGADWTCRSQAREWASASAGAAGRAGAAGVPEALWPWGSAAANPLAPVTPSMALALQNVGQRASTPASGTLVLTAVAGTPAFTTGPASLTAAQAVAQRGSFNLDSRLREAPLDFTLLPASESDDPADFTGWFTTT